MKGGKKRVHIASTPKTSKSGCPFTDENNKHSCQMFSKCVGFDSQIHSNSMQNVWEGGAHLKTNLVCNFQSGQSFFSLLVEQVGGRALLLTERWHIWCVNESAASLLVVYLSCSLRRPLQRRSERHIFDLAFSCLLWLQHGGDQN